MSDQQLKKPGAEKYNGQPAVKGSFLDIIKASVKNADKKKEG
jgi:hypothetical protein